MKQATIDWAKTDALIFDMDGTLWDAVDSYCKVWDECFASFGVDKKVTRGELITEMGKQLDEIYFNVSKGHPLVPPEQYLPRLEEIELTLMPKLGGVPYKGLKDGLEQLSKKYVLILLSNCGVDGLKNMMSHTGITEYITEEVTFGATQRQKDENMIILKEKYKLIQPVYIGDTEGDCSSTRKAGLPFVFAAYGFGTCKDPDLSFNSFEELSNFFLSIK